MPRNVSASSICWRKRFEHVAHARLSRGQERVDVGTAEQDGLRSQRERLDDIRAAAHAAVHQELDLVADRLDHLREDRQGGTSPSSTLPPWFEITIASARLSSTRRIDPPTLSSRRRRAAPPPASEGG
jgi:hypothetical protein